jgi:hypothetical protein
MPLLRPGKPGKVALRLIQQRPLLRFLLETPNTTSEKGPDSRQSVSLPIVCISQTRGTFVSVLIYVKVSASD